MENQMTMNKRNATPTAGATKEPMQPALDQEGIFLKDQHDAARNAVVNTPKLGWAVAGLTVALLLLMAGSAAWGAVPVPIANPGFEDLISAGDGSDGDYDYATDPAGGYYYTWPLPNWGYYGQDYSGIWNPTSTAFTVGVPGGECVGFVEADTRADPGPLTGGLTQVLGTDLAANTGYTLIVKVGNPIKVDYTFNTFPGYRVQLWAGGILLAEDANTVAVPTDTWITSSVTYTSSLSVTPGQKLEIRLVNMGISQGGSGQDHYVMYDDVQLTATPPPPPTIISSGPLTGASFPLTFSGASNQTYQVLSSTNVVLPLASWTVLTIGSFGASQVTYTNTSATNATQFYLIQSPAP